MLELSGEEKKQDLCHKVLLLLTKSSLGRILELPWEPQ